MHPGRGIVSVFGVLAVLVVLTSVASSAAVQENPISGSYWYAVDHITSASEDAEILIWVTVPPQWHGQSIKLLKVVPEPVAILTDEVSGNQVIEWLVRPDAKQPPLNEFFHYEFELDQRQVRVEVDPAALAPYDAADADYLKYTAAETWIQTDGGVLDTARAIVGEQRNPWLQAELIYDWIIESMDFVPGGHGNLDAVATLAGRKGDCGQYSRLFVALCRSVGIPARTVTNGWLEGGFHVFAEIMMPGHGWVPADPAVGQMLQPDGGGLDPDEVEAFMAKRNIPLGDPRWLLGNLFDGRVVTSVGNNIDIVSPTLGRRVRFMEMRPGGIDANPAAARLTGLNADVVHGGFFVFGRQIQGAEEAHALTHQLLADSFFKVDLYEVVEDECRLAASASDDGIRSWINMGKVYMHKKEYYRAEAAFKRAMNGMAVLRREKLEGLIWTHNYLGNCYDLLGFRDMALAEYQTVIDLGDNYRGAVDYARKYLADPFVEPDTDASQ